MKISVRLHGEAKRGVVGLIGDDMMVDVHDGLTVAQVLARVGVADENVWMSAVNKTVVKPDHVVCDGDAIEVIAPIQGGA